MLFKYMVKTGPAIQDLLHESLNPSEAPNRKEEYARWFELRPTHHSHVSSDGSTEIIPKCEQPTNDQDLEKKVCVVFLD